MCGAKTPATLSPRGPEAGGVGMGDSERQDEGVKSRCKRAECWTPDTMSRSGGGGPRAISDGQLRSCSSRHSLGGSEF